MADNENILNEWWPARFLRIASVERENDRLRLENRELRNELYLLRTAQRDAHLIGSNAEYLLQEQKDLEELFRG